jgi:hypothetical protein
MINRNNLTFEPFFNAGVDRVTGECDVEGTDVFDNGHYAGSLNWVTPEEVNQMTDEELEEKLLENGIFV